MPLVPLNLTFSKAMLPAGKTKLAITWLQFEAQLQHVQKQMQPILLAFYRKVLPVPVKALPVIVPERPKLRGVAWTGNLLFCTFVLGFGIWAVFAPLKSAAIAVGVVEAETSRKTIQHLEGGIVRKILVRNGDAVSAGQILIQLDDTKTRSELDSLQGQFWDTQASRDRLISEQNDYLHITFTATLEQLAQQNPTVSAIVVGQRSLFETRRDLYQSEIAITHERMEQVNEEIGGLIAQKRALSARADITDQQLAMITPLVKKGLERKSSVLNLEREKVDIEGKLGETVSQIARAYQVINEAQATLVKLERDRKNEIAKELRDTDNQLLLLGERIRAVKDQLIRTSITAPEDGTIVNLRIFTAAGVIGAGEPLLDLVPKNGNLIIASHVRPEDINLVHEGLNAQVHLLPYDQRRVPYLKGKVTYVSADRLVDQRTGQPYYAATIRVTDEAQMKASDIEMIPGMPAQALIETGESTVALYAIRPLIDSFHRAFREN